MQITIIRHGKTIANEKRLYCGKTDLPLLADNGIEPSKYPKSPDLYFTSGMLRANQTLDLIYGNVKREKLPELAEYNFGDFEMKSHAELEGRDDYQKWITDDRGNVPCPNGESRAKFKGRVLYGFICLCIKSRAADSVFVVCHGGVIVNLMDCLFPGTKNFYEWQPPVGGGYILNRKTEETNENLFNGVYSFDFSSLR